MRFFIPLAQKKKNLNRSLSCVHRRHDEFGNYQKYLKAMNRKYYPYRRVMLCVCVSACVRAQVPSETEKGVRSPEARVMGVCEPPEKCAGNQTLSPLKDFFTSEPSL